MPTNAFIIVPCYNEGAVLRETLNGILALGYSNIVVVDDGSIQNPWQSLEDLPIHFIRHTVNLGQGAALQTGMDYAKRLGADAVVHFDADGQHAPDDIKRLLDALNEADVALGSRFLRKANVTEIPLTKRCLLRCARLVNFCFTGLWLSDAHNGFRALGSKAMTVINLRENRMAHATEIVSQIKKAGLSFREIPISIKYTDYSRKKGQKWYNSINILIDLILNKIM